MKVSPVKQPSLVDLVEEKIVEAVLEAGLGVGDELPGEMELAGDLGVSRNVVREALSRLRMLGVIESRKRRGMILTEPDVLSGIIRVLDLPVLSDTTQEDMFELRVILELGVGDLVFPHRTEENLQELEELVQREEKAPQDLGTALECDIAFHKCLYRMTQNETLSRFQALLAPFFKWKGEALFNPHRFEDNDAVSHRDLLEILKHGTPDEFRETMHKHIGNNLECIQRLRAERAARAENDGTEGEEAEISQTMIGSS